MEVVLDRLDEAGVGRHGVGRDRVVLRAQLERHAQGRASLLDAAAVRDRRVAELERRELREHAVSELEVDALPHEDRSDMHRRLPVVGAGRPQAMLEGRRPDARAVSAPEGGNRVALADDNHVYGYVVRDAELATARALGSVAS